MNTLVYSANSFTALCYSCYFPTAANEPKVSHIHRKQITSVLKNKEDTTVQKFGVGKIF